MPAITQAMKHFLGAEQYVVIGSVLTDRSRFDNKVLRWYIDHGYPVTPMKPGSGDDAGEAEGLPIISSLEGRDLSRTSISIIINPIRGLPILQSLFARPKGGGGTDGPRGVWFQPGAESDEIKAFVEEHHGLGDKVVLGGPCVLRDGDKVLAELNKDQGSKS